MNQFTDLFANRLHHAWWTMAKQSAAPAREEIEITIAFRIPDPGAFTAHEAYRIALVVADDIAIMLSNRIDGGECVRHQSISKSIHDLRSFAMSGQQFRQQ